MLRRVVSANPPAAGAPAAANWSRRSLVALCKVLRQRQHEHILSQQHGSGFVRHDAPLGGEFRPAKAPDLQHSDVHLGFGTSEQDPYVRTLPNVPLMPPESTVLSSGTEKSATLDEVASLGTRWGSLAYWVGGSYPRLPLFLKSRQSQSATRIAFTHDMEGRLQNVESDIPSILSQYASSRTTTEVMAVLNKAKAALDALSGDLFGLSPDVFDEEVAAAHQSLLKQLDELGLSLPEMISVADAMAAKCGHLRNTQLQELAEFVSHPDFSNSSNIWETFFEVAEERFAELGLSSELRFVWDHQCRRARPPSMKAATALYVLLSFPSLRDARRNAGGKSPSTVSAATPMRAVDAPIAAKRAFLLRTLPGFITAYPPAEFITSLKESGASSEICEALTLYSITAAAEAKSTAAEAASLVSIFESYAMADTYLQLLVQNIKKQETASVRQLLMSVFAIPQEASGDMRGAMNRQLQPLRNKWRSHYEAIATPLLSDFQTTCLLESLIANEMRGTQDKPLKALCEKHVVALRQVIQARRSRAEVKDSRTAKLLAELSDFALMDRTIRGLEVSGLSVRELELAAAEHAQKNKRADGAASVPKALASPSVIGRLLKEVASQHPSWVQNNVLDVTPHALSTGGGSSPSCPASLANLVRIFVRLTWVPQAGQAMIKARTRRRIGPVGLEPTQQNVAAEIGQVEAYDNLQYKRFDWQGWYQRMVDIHNRNVSVKCRLDDLKQLDSSGRPFVDLQSERRLRVVAAERVGRGILKLDSDRFEDRQDNLEFGLGKLSEVLADARKTMLGEEYWPSVEVKVRRPSGQTKMRYSVLDDARIEARSKELYEKYKATKEKKVFVTPMDTWLDVTGVASNKTGADTNQDGYNVESVYASMEDGEPGQ